MVDCGNLRCFQERRSIKKDLLSWSKKVPVAVGLETIAEHFGSKRKIRKLFEPFNCLEDKEPHDWEPEENCFYCKGRIQLLFDAIEKTDSKDGSRILRDHPSLRHLGEILPFCPQFYTSNFGRDILIDIKSIQNEPEPPAVVPEPASKPNIELKIPTVSPSKQKKEVISSGKKGYSETELSAAVTDIRNGKLGTRRAASLYGIPRSTLRNKIFKLENDDSSVSAMLTDDDGDSNESVMPLKQPLHQQQQQQQTNKPENALQLSDLLQISTLQYLAPIAMPYMLKPDLSMLVENSEWERKLQHIRHKHNLSKASMNHYMEKALAHKLKPYQQELIRKLTHERLELEKNNLGHIPSHMIAGSRHDNTKSLTHSIILKALEQNSSPLKSPHQTKPSENGSLLDTTALSQSALMKALNMEPSLLTAVSSSLDSLSNIVVPAYKSSYHKGSKVKEEDMEKKSHKGFYKYENTRIGDTLKDIIIKTISEKVRCKLESTDFSGLVGTGSNLEKQKTKETLMSAFSIPDLCSPAKKIKQEVPDVESNKPHHNSHSSSSSSTQTKKTRPKRGQYRKYNSQLLTEAVKAVQRGEMSVHRAGSYYGVPHSTLEYKVKERHLLRQKKIKEQQEQKQKEAEEAKKKAEQVDSSTKASSEKNSSDTESSSPSKSFSGPSWLPPFVGASPFEGSASLGMFGSGFALSTPASELLRKLQHKVQS